MAAFCLASKFHGDPDRAGLVGRSRQISWIASYARSPHGQSAAAARVTADARGGPSRRLVRVNPKCASP